MAGDLVVRPARTARGEDVRVRMVVADPHAERFHLKLGFGPAGETAASFGAAAQLRKLLP